MNPGEVIRVATKFDLPPVPFDVPLQPQMKPGIHGNEYV